MAAKVLVIDGQGGGLGRQLVSALAAACPKAELTAVGTNSLAANAMLKAACVPLSRLWRRILRSSFIATLSTLRR